jgi:hypothetical protein
VLTVKHSYSDRHREEDAMHGPDLAGAAEVEAEVEVMVDAEAETGEVEMMH